MGSLIVAALMVLGAVLGCPRAIAAQGDLDRVLATLEGSWEGEGELLGRPATFMMTWEIALNGKFLRLDFRNAFADIDPVHPVLESHAYYLLGGPTLTGQWMDSRGVILSLRAEVVGSALVTHWTGEESGRTEYRVIDEDTLEVIDYVRAEGEYRLFAKARYRRVR
ncbi:MAG: hypothetical protein IH921_11745 [Gemmatimonadetes bacterium]|nr:hypothetical protein [Gemmatimonadota bacterium]